ncbi:hypothetical protein ACH33_16135 [Aneurinibacillus sp. XH2]|uniref:sirohydrochlorin chelatase n=1 Tax=Aneurinibacillus sp. XH2 TaxID=1450761 RepID=UPI00070DC4C9|nr:CbiX/SirB N-terminal domain-containing protein [Aneurinibacillus sp. XH2]AMA74195.1 hypothetical protein ACH33_16135 [Aneurinibacillus sp. XH2]
MKQGVLVISHGSRNRTWVAKVEELLQQVHAACPLEVTFLDMVEGRTIGEGMKRLEAQGVEEIIVVPLFVSSGSTHLQEIRYALGFTSHLDIKTWRHPLSIGARVIWTEPMNDHPKIRELLHDRVREFSVRPSEEMLMLVAHGSDVPGFKERWQQMLEGLGSTLCCELGLKGAVYATIHPDTIASRARTASGEGRLIVVPVFLSPGYYTEKAIPKRLAGIPHRYSGRAYLPDQRVVLWLEETIAAHLRR